MEEALDKQLEEIFSKARDRDYYLEEDTIKPPLKDLIARSNAAYCAQRLEELRNRRGLGAVPYVDIDQAIATEQRKAKGE